MQSIWNKYKIGIGVAVAMLALGIVWAMASPAKADGLPRSGLVPIGEVAAAATAPWSGFYGGLHAGKGWGDWDGRQSYSDNSPAVEAIYGAFDSSNHGISADGTIAGGQVGWNFQAGSLVWGLEADASWSRLSGSDVLVPYPNDPAHGTGVGTPDWGFSIRNDWLATVRGRLGVAAGPTLIYGTGGIAFGGFREGHTVVGYPDPNGRGGTLDSTEIGWTVGGGVEWALSSKWTAKAEYLYYSFPDVGGKFTPKAVYGHATDSFEGDFNIHTVRMGINYRF